MTSGGREPASDTNRPLLILVAGPNGAGKTTVINRLRADPSWLQQVEPGFEFPAHHINPDEIAAELIDIRDPRARSKTAQQIADAEREAYLANRISFSFETVMSHPSKIAVMQIARRRGYRVILIFIGTDDPVVNLIRVKDRVAVGGHPVPDDKVVSRYPRTMGYLAKAVECADVGFIYDNSNEEPTIVAITANADVSLRDGIRIPEWIEQRLIQPLAERAELQIVIDEFRSHQQWTMEVADEISGIYVGRVVFWADWYFVQQTGNRECVRHDGLMVRITSTREDAVRIVYRNGGAEVLAE